MPASEQPGIKVICLLSGPRTGSTRVLWLLNGYSRLYARAEIFNPEVAESLEAECADLARAAHIGGVTRPTDGRLTAWMRQHPNRVIDWFIERAAGRTFLFKLFPGHIADAKEQSRLIQRPDIGFMIIRRKPIDVYISMQKAKVTEAMRHVDTTAIKIEGNVDEFIRISSQMQAWYRYCLNEMAKTARPQTSIGYDGEINQPDEMTLRAIEERLQLLGVDPGTYSEAGGAPLFRQDRAESYEQKMANWESFAAGLKARLAYFPAFQE